MTFESHVKEYEKLKFKLKSIEIKENELRMLGGFPKSNNTEGMPKTKSSASSVENIAIRLTELLEQKSVLQEEIQVKRKTLETLIGYISNLVSREIVESKTFLPCGWKYISLKSHLSTSRCRHLYYDGIYEIKEILKSKEGIYE